MDAVSSLGLGAVDFQNHGMLNPFQEPIMKVAEKLNDPSLTLHL